jgi:hypothetical protein
MAFRKLSHWLWLALSNRPKRVGVSLHSPEEGNTPNFRNIVVSIYLESRTIDTVHKLGYSQCYYAPSSEPRLNLLANIFIRGRVCNVEREVTRLRFPPQTLLSFRGSLDQRSWDPSFSGPDHHKWHAERNYPGSFLALSNPSTKNLLHPVQRFHNYKPFDSILQSFQVSQHRCRC